MLKIKTFLFIVLCLGGEYLTCLRRLRVRDSARYNSSLVSVNIKDEVAVMKLDRKPVNSFSLEFLEEINTSLEALEQNNDVRGLILSSVSVICT